MFDVVVHSDWSMHPRGRWAATAYRAGSGWRIGAPEPVGALPAFRHGLLAMAGSGASVLAGFDFPIGVPAVYGMRTGLSGFREALTVFGQAEGWTGFYDLAATPEAISLRRPFYPGGAGAGARVASLVAGLGLRDAGELLRACERRGAGRKRASPLFWTVGAAQVGRAAITGWQEVIGPALQAGASLWPFAGSLADLAGPSRLVLAETYPADAYAVVGAPFRAGESKRRQADRRGKAAAIFRWAETRQTDLTDCAAVLSDGFGPTPSGEDAFDALLGALAMLEVVADPRRAMSAALPPEQFAWEGWILGR